MSRDWVADIKKMHEYYGVNNVVAGSDAYAMDYGNDPQRISIGLRHTF